MGKSTISTGPFSIANCKRLPEAIWLVVGQIGENHPNDFGEKNSHVPKHQPATSNP